MKVQYAPTLIRLLKKANVRIRRQFLDRIAIFMMRPDDPQLNNHALTDDWLGFRSIDVTADYRAIYEEISGPDEPMAYFVDLGTHKQLYRKKAA